jgi:hypothetical protein
VAGEINKGRIKIKKGMGYQGHTGTLFLTHPIP